MEKEFKLEHITNVRVRYADTDKMGIVYNAEYLVYFEVGRTELMRHYGMPYTDFEKAGYSLPLVESYIKYFTPAKYDDVLYIKATYRPEFKPTLKFEYNIFTDNSTIAKGHTIHSYVKVGSLKPVKPPKIFLDLIDRIKAKNI